MIRNLSRSTNRKSAGTCYDEPSCSRYVRQEEARRDDRTSEISNCTKCALGRRLTNASSRGIVGCSKCKRCVGDRERDDDRTSGSEMTGRSSPPKPPRRLLRKKNTLPRDDVSIVFSYLLIILF